MQTDEDQQNSVSQEILSLQNLLTNTPIFSVNEICRIILKLDFKELAKYIMRGTDLPEGLAENLFYYFYILKDQEEFRTMINSEEFSSEELGNLFLFSFFMSLTAKEPEARYFMAWYSVLSSRKSLELLTSSAIVSFDEFMICRLLERLDRNDLRSFFTIKETAANTIINLSNPNMEHLVRNLFQKNPHVLEEISQFLARHTVESITTETKLMADIIDFEKKFRAMFAEEQSIEKIAEEMRQFDEPIFEPEGRKRSSRRIRRIISLIEDTNDPIKTFHALEQKKVFFDLIELALVENCLTNHDYRQMVLQWKKPTR